jgi:hypothetical protein
MLYPVHLQIRAMMITILAVDVVPSQLIPSEMIPRFWRMILISPCVAKIVLKIRA